MLACFSEKISFWSITLILLSVVFLLALLFNGVNLSGNLWYLPLSCYLHVSWVLLTISFLLGLVARRQNAIQMIKHEKKYMKDLRIINFMPALFAVGFILLLVFVIGATCPVIKGGMPKDCDDSGRKMHHRMEWMMMKNFHDFKDKKWEGMSDEKREEFRKERKSRTR